MLTSFPHYLCPHFSLPISAMTTRFTSTPLPRRIRHHAIKLYTASSLQPPPLGVHELLLKHDDQQGDSSQSSPRSATHTSNNHNTMSTAHQASQNHPADTTGRQPVAPIGSATAAANDIHHQQHVADKGATSAAVSDASAKGQTTRANGGAVAGVAQAAAYGPSSSSAPSHTHSSSNRQDRTREAERIVEEERQASEKMPNYPGLAERFTLISKMGDGAFSNVYKARDKQTGQKVAIKVVRKYELNSNQVSFSCSIYPPPPCEGAPAQTHCAHPSMHRLHSSEVSPGPVPCCLRDEPLDVGSRPPRCLLHVADVHARLVDGPFLLASRKVKPTRRNPAG